MAYDWSSIRGEETAELRMYRLLGEMLARRATGRDLEILRDFLAVERPGVDAWHSLGEALFHTTRGGAAGYVLWSSWGKAIAGSDYDEGQMLAAWQRFRIDASEGLEQSTDAEQVRYTVFDEPMTLQVYDFDDEWEADDEMLSRTNVLRAERVEPPITSVLADSAPRLLSFIPTGPFTLRIFDEIYDDVDEYTILALLRRGLFLGADVLFGGRWIRAAEHPAFDTLIRHVRDEARRVLASQRCEAPEKTYPGDI